MPRFDRKKYHPMNDSSVSLIQMARDEKAVCLVSGVGLCPCGCGQEPKGKKATFAMGHDQRLRGILIRAHLTDTQVVTVGTDVNGKRHTAGASAMEHAKAHGWEKSLTDAVARREKANHKVVHKAMNSKRLIKVGRWPYTGQVAAVYSTPKGEEYLIEFVTKTGDTKQVRVPAEKAPLAEGAAA